MIASHAFGWRGMTTIRALRDPVSLRTLRWNPSMTLIELIEAEARGR